LRLVRRGVGGEVGLGGAQELVLRLFIGILRGTEKRVVFGLSGGTEEFFFFNTTTASLYEMVYRIKHMVRCSDIAANQYTFVFA